MWLLEVGLVGTFFVGLYRGNTGVVVNTGVALAVTQVCPCSNATWACR